jgi:hypothetical protein
MFKLSEGQTRELLAQPESGMGYQVVDATLADDTTTLGVVYNAELLSLDNELPVSVPIPYRTRLASAKSASGQIKSLRLVPRTRSTTFSVARESSAANQAGPAKDGPDEKTNAGEVFKRFSAYVAAPAYGQRGGGVEVIFTAGTQPNTVTGPYKIPDY